MFGSEVPPSPGTYFHSVGGELPLPGAQVPIFPVVGISLSVSQPAILLSDLGDSVSPFSAFPLCVGCYLMQPSAAWG